VEEDLVAWLLADAAVAALAAARINWNLRPQGERPPAIVLQLIHAASGYGPGHRDRLRGYLVQVDCWGGTFREAKQLARAVRAALDRLPPPFQGPGFVEAERDDAYRDEAPAAGGGPTDLHRTSLDVRVWRQDL
jgi:hypothetical protein